MWSNSRLVSPAAANPPSPDPHAPLRDDVRLLGTLLGDTLRAREGDDFFSRIERVRAIARAAHDGDR